MSKLTPIQEELLSRDGLTVVTTIEEITDILKGL